MNKLFTLFVFSTLIASCGGEYAEVRGLPGADGKNGSDGIDGQSIVGPQGDSGAPGQNGSPAYLPGLACNVHNLPSYDSSTSLPLALAGNPVVGNFILPNLSVPDSPSSAGFPGMPSSLQALVGLEGYALDCSGYLNVPTSGLHSFKLLSDDGSRVAVEDIVIVQNQGLHAPSTVAVSGIALNKGRARFNVVYYQGPHTQIALQLKWSGPNLLEQVIPDLYFTH